MVITAGVIMHYSVDFEDDEERKDDGDTNYKTYEYREVEGLQMNISLEKANYSSSELINVAVTLFNANSRGIFVQELVIGGNVLFNITNSTGEQVPQYVIFDWSAPFFPLESNETYTTELSLPLQSIYSLSEPDTYSMTGHYTYILGHWIVNLKSNRINFTILP
jgi:hypothetical protein